MRRPTLLAGLVALAPLFASGFARADVTPLMFVDSTEKVTVPTGLLTTIGSTFPEGVHVGASLLSSTYDPNLILSAQAELRVSYLYQGASYKSALGYFTWTTDGVNVTIVDRQLIFPYCSGAGQPLHAGDTVTLRDASGNVRVFQPGERVGFFVVANGWTGSAVSGWNPSAPTLPSTNPAQNDTSGNGGVANGVETTVDALNPANAQGHPELARQAILLQMANVPGVLSGGAVWVLGFEDEERTLSNDDDDFNDVMFQVQAYAAPTFTTPDNTPIETSLTATFDASNPDPDGDGVAGLSDYFPEDPTRAFINSTPPTGLETLAFEDLYPRIGDADYNDAVVQYSMDQITDASNNLKQLVGTFHLIARGAGLDHHFGVALHGLPPSATGTVQMESFSTDGVESLSPPAALPALQQDPSGAWMVRLDDLIASTMAALPPVAAEHGCTNTWFATPSRDPASVRFIVTFDTAVATASMGTPPYDPYLLVVHPDGLYDVHRPGYLPFPGRPAGLPAETGPGSFLDPNGYPFELLVPSDWRYPLESVGIDKGGRGLPVPYTQFASWRSSDGVSSSSWYTAPRIASNPCVTNSLSNQVRERPWLLSVLQ
jgi:LruC domain-containing protein